MTVDASFFVAGAWTKGTIVTGVLDGAGHLRVGDSLVRDGQPFEIVGIEKFKRVVDEAGAGEAVGLALGPGVDKGGFDGRYVTFRARSSSGVPGRSPHGGFVPSRLDAVVRWGTRKGRTADWGILSFDALTATLRGADGATVFDEACLDLTVTADSVDLWVTRPDGAGTSLRGPTPKEVHRDQVRALAERGRAAVAPDPGLSGPHRWWEKLMFSRASARLRWQIYWRRALVVMFEARGAGRAGQDDAGRQSG
jgi:hypothetical protein